MASRPVRVLTDDEGARAAGLGAGAQFDVAHPVRLAGVLVRRTSRARRRREHSEQALPQGEPAAKCVIPGRRRTRRPGPSARRASPGWTGRSRHAGRRTARRRIPIRQAPGRAGRSSAGSAAGSRQRPAQCDRQEGEARREGGWLHAQHADRLFHGLYLILHPGWGQRIKDGPGLPYGVWARRARRRLRATVRAWPAAAHECRHAQASTKPHTSVAGGGSAGSGPARARWKTRRTTTRRPAARLRRRPVGPVRAVGDDAGQRRRQCRCVELHRGDGRGGQGFLARRRGMKTRVSR